MAHSRSMDFKEFFLELIGIASAGYILRRFNAVRIRFRDLDIVLVEQRSRDPDPERGPVGPSIEN